MGAASSKAVRNEPRGDEARLLAALESSSNSSVSRRVALVLGFGSLISVNLASGLGVFGPTNAVVSNSYPTSITPAGFAFAIWGVIFLLEGGGVVFVALPAAEGSVRNAMLRAVSTPWLVMWTCQNLWQLVFSRTPLDTPSSIALGRIFLPCSLLLLASFSAGLTSCRRINAAGVGNHAAGLLVALPAGLNTGWLSAASSIGLALVGQTLAGGVDAFNATGLPLVLTGGATLSALNALRVWGTGYLGLGYRSHLLYVA